MSTALQRPIGSRVIIDDAKYPGVWIVKRNGPVNATLEREGGGGRGLRAPHTMLLDPPANGTAVVTTVPVATFYDPGQIVRIADGKYAGLWVVIADKGGDRVNLARLGGDGGRYLRAARRGLTVIDPQDILK